MSNNDFFLKLEGYEISRAALLAMIFSLLAVTGTPALSTAADFAGSLKGVTVTDQAGVNVPPTAVINYTKSGYSVDFDASASTDSDGTIAQYKWDFGDGTSGSGATTAHTFTATGNYPVTLNVVDDKGGVALTQILLSAAPLVDSKINFQPASVPIPSGYQVDSGAVFNATRGYGWATSLTQTRDRNNVLSPDQAYDTLIHVPPTSVWEHTLAPGKYSVTVTVGDPTSPDVSNSIQVEGTALFDSVPLTSSQKWVTRTAVVEVSDGKLTLTFTGSSSVAKLCWLRIQST